MSPHNDLGAHFNHYFEVIPADTPELVKEALRLRYEVYCKEACIAGFNPADYPDGLESDRYDRHSVHCLLRHRPTGSYAGTVRLILADPSDPEAPFPIELHARRDLRGGTVDPRSLPRYALGEVSRFILSQRFRSRAGERHSAYGVSEVSDFPPSANERRVLPHPILGLIKAGVLMSWEREIAWWYAGMELKLVRLLRHFGLDFQRISRVVQYHGPCRAYLGDIPHIMCSVYDRRREVWALLTDDGKIWPVS